ncbi:MAG: hypothetical protein HY922_10940 [Elusimicrobia bacterium]|nr:hypothetical protein [Elusimicrobiota bacterium]
MTGRQEFTAYCIAIAAAQLALAAAFLRRLKAERDAALAPCARPVSIIVPCKGRAEGFDENIRSMLEQDYEGETEYLFVTPSREDPAHVRLAELLSSGARARPLRLPGSPARTGERRTACARLLASGATPKTCSGKIVDLLYALERASPSSELFVFADSDLRVPSGWLRSLCAPLDDPGVGAASTCALYLPVQASLWALFKLLWIAWYQPVLTLIYPQVIGHSFALRKRDFKQWDVAGAWSRSLMEDHTLTRIVQASGLRIVFTLREMPVSLEACSLRPMTALFAKWIALNRIYEPGIWAFLALAAAFKAVVLAWVIRPPTTWRLLALLAAGEAASAWLLLQGHELLYPGRFSSHKPAFRNLPLAAALAAPLLPLFQAFVFVKAAFVRDIRWGGRRYRIQGPEQVEAVPE